LKKLGTDVPVHFTAFHPDYKIVDRPATPAETLTNARAIAMSHGLRFVYTGNVHDSTGSSTYCPSCGKRIIERDWFVLGEYHVTQDGHCSFCQAVIPGRFDANPGQWGSKRTRVQINE
ncbi:MAG: AmmeMemoRadiSam system radical SAM enzyme, partial [Candidatus Omnitrophica bacterium]|nr:AmmeMemoRadiSam system radical SAM enzyme [Candidatus Omnitrophota bacterium]